MIQGQQRAIVSNDWKWFQLSNLLEFVIGGDWGKDENFDDKNYDLAYCIRGSEIRNWQSDKGVTASLRKIKLSNLEKRKLQEGDILLEISGGGPDQPVGRTVLIDKQVLSFKPSVPKICTNFLRLLRPLKSINPKYLNNYLQFFYNSGEIVGYQAGSNNLRNLKYPDYAKIKIPVPPREIQNSIVSKIEELFSELDKGIENLKLAQQQLKVYRQSVLKWAFEGRLTNENVKEGELPEGWKLETLGTYITDISAGKSIRCDERPPKTNEFGIVKVSAVSWGLFDESESKTCLSQKNYNKDYIIKSGDFLFSRANTIELVGACVIVGHTNGNLMLSDKILRFQFNIQISNEYVLYYLRSKQGRKQIESLSTGNQESMRNIGQAKIKMINIPYCKLKEQLEIVNEINDRFSIIDKMEESINQSLQQAEMMRQSILKKAFEGQLIN